MKNLEKIEKVKELIHRCKLVPYGNEENDV